jgi:phosphatidate cytidylyltransferase
MARAVAGQPVPGTGGKPGNWRDLGLRSAVAAILIPVVILDTWLGGVWFEAMVAAIGVLIAREWATIVHKADTRQLWIHAATSVLAAIFAHHFTIGWTLLLIAAGWASSIGLLLQRGRRLDFWSVAGVPYVSLPIAALIVLRDDGSYGFVAIAWIFAVVWLADTLAYFAGKTIGGPKLAPKISPNKTWAGLGGAVAGGILGSLLVAGVAGLNWLVVVAFLGGVLAVVEQLGDLFESAAKRHFGLKDSGSIIPGHGGVLDRVDGLIAVAIAAAVLGLMRGGTQAPATGLLVW